MLPLICLYKGEVMKNKDREKLSAVFRIGALAIAVIMIIGFIFQSFMGVF